MYIYVYIYIYMCVCVCVSVCVCVILFVCLPQAWETSKLVSVVIVCGFESSFQTPKTKTSLNHCCQFHPNKVLRDNNRSRDVWS